MTQEILQKIKTHFAKFEFQEIVDLVQALENPSNTVLDYQAHSLFELGAVNEAKKIYEQTQNYSAQGFCFLILDDFESAQAAYLKANTSAAQKWGLFVTLLFSRCNKTFPGPGFLSFRLFFESTYGYLLKFQKSDFIDRINECKTQLAVLYPDIDLDIKKALSII